MDAKSIDDRINSEQDAIKYACDIVNSVVDPNEVQPFIRQGIAGPSIIKAQKLADCSQKIRLYGSKLIQNIENKSFEEMVQSGEFALVLLCAEMKVQSQSTPKQSGYHYLKKSKKKWWQFWK